MLSINHIGSNMTELSFSGGKVLFSYNTPVAFIDKSGYQYATSKKWSATTSKHINKWLYGAKDLKPQEFFDNLVSQFDMKGI